MDAVQRSPGSGSVRFLTGPLAGKTFQITKPVVSIGRETDNDIVISDPSVSRHHARLFQHNGQWHIEKLSQPNTLTINQSVAQSAPLKDRDTVGLGTGTTFLFTLLAIPQAPAAIEQTVRDQAPMKIGRIPAPPAPLPPTIPSGADLQKGPHPQPPGDFGTSQDGGSLPSAPIGTPSLEVSSNISRSHQIYPLGRQAISIGRDPSNEIVVNDPIVSGFHAQIVHEQNQLVLIHPHPKRQKTLNGLLYQGQHIDGATPYRHILARGDIFRIGDEHGTLVTLTFNDGSGAAQEIKMEMRPISLGAPVLTLGRLPDNTVVLDHPQVSAHHARLEQVAHGYQLIDLGSTNHVYVNAQQITNQALTPGDEIRIGPFKLTYTGTELRTQDESSSIRIDALHLQQFGNQKTILINDISLAIPPRKFVALVGGSGTGKSTLMNALNGLRPAQQGVVLYNGQDYYKHLAAFSTQLGYVPQDDIIHRDLTVERALYYAAKLRLPEDFSEAQIKQRVNEVLDDVEMKFRRKLLVNKLSGGQRKRVSIAMELLANPSVFFLDEPTSGLDPGLDRKMMFLLRRLADKGHTIVLVTHATNNINTCDYVCFLAQGGRLAYFGPPNEAKTYFDKTDFAEIYSALEPTDENPNIPVEAEQRFQASPDFQKYVVTSLNQGPAAQHAAQQPTQMSKPIKRGNPLRQFLILSRRYLELLKNDSGNLMILLLQAPIIALLLLFMIDSGTFFPTSIATCPQNSQIPASTPGEGCEKVVNALNTPQGAAFLIQKGLTASQALQESIAPGSGGNAQKILFIMAFAAVMFGSINGAREIVKEAPIYRRERAVNLGIAPYMFSKIIVLGVLCFFQSLILVLVVNLRSPFKTSVFLSPVTEIFITMLLTAIAGLMVGLTVSAIAPNNDRAMSFIPIILIPQVIFSGIIFPLNGPVLQLIGALFPARWAMAGLGSTVGLHGDKLGADDFSFQGTLFSQYSQGQATTHLLFVWAALIVMIIALGFAISYFLKKKDIRR